MAPNRKAPGNEAGEFNRPARFPYDRLRPVTKSTWPEMTRGVSHLEPWFRATQSRPYRQHGRRTNNRSGHTMRCDFILQKRAIHTAHGQLPDVNLGSLFPAEFISSRATARISNSASVHGNTIRRARDREKTDAAMPTNQLFPPYPRGQARVCENRACSFTRGRPASRASVDACAACDDSASLERCA
jgi:hypothetical protein